MLPEKRHVPAPSQGLGNTRRGGCGMLCPPQSPPAIKRCCTQRVWSSCRDLGATGVTVPTLGRGAGSAPLRPVPGQVSLRQCPHHAGPEQCPVTASAVSPQREPHCTPVSPPVCLSSTGTGGHVQGLYFGDAQGICTRRAGGRTHHDTPVPSHCRGHPSHGCGPSASAAWRPPHPL